MDRPVLAVLCKQPAALGQEANEFVTAELTDPLGELAVAGLSFAGDVACDGNVIGRVDDHDVAALVLHQLVECGLRSRIAAMDAMAAESPAIADLANSHSRHRGGIIDV